MKRMGRVAALGLGLCLSGCISVNSSSGADGTDGADGSLSITSLSVTPETVADGESFEVKWKVSHTTQSGWVTEMGLFVGTDDELDSSASLDSVRFFNVAITAGAPNKADDSSISCKRTGTIVKCGETNGGRDIAGETDFTFRACSSYVLSMDEECEYRAVSLSFP